VFSFLVILQIAGQNKIPQTGLHCFIDSTFLKRLVWKNNTINNQAVPGNETGKGAEIQQPVPEQSIGGAVVSFTRACKRLQHLGAWQDV